VSPNCQGSPQIPSFTADRRGGILISSGFGDNPRWVISPSKGRGQSASHIESRPPARAGEGTQIEETPIVKHVDSKAPRNAVTWCGLTGDSGDAQAARTVDSAVREAVPPGATPIENTYRYLERDVTRVEAERSSGARALSRRVDGPRATVSDRAREKRWYSKIVV